MSVPTRFNQVYAVQPCSSKMFMLLIRLVFHGKFSKATRQIGC